MRAPLLVLFAVAGCSSILPEAKPQTYYDLKYDPQPVQCERAYSAPVQVWEFAAAAPYDRSAMAVTHGREVSLSQGHQWVDRPGVLVAGKLIRDLNGGRLFPLAVSPRDPQGAPLELTGELYKFGWDKSGGAAVARLEADVVLRSTGDHARVLLHKRYAIDSPAIADTGDAAAFAKAMSGVAGTFSALLRRDLCEAAPPG